MSKDLDELARIKEAQDRADRIRAGFSQVADWWRDVIKAYGARDWESLGYTGSSKLRGIDLYPVAARR
jgi:hypothetical protein